MDTLPDICKLSFPDSQIARYLKMDRTTYKKILMTQLDPYAKHKLIAKLQNTFFSIIMDETTDLSCKKCLVVMVKYWDDGSFFGFIGSSRWYG